MPDNEAQTPARHQPVLGSVGRHLSVWGAANRECPVQSAVVHRERLYPCPLEQSLSASGLGAGGGKTLGSGGSAWRPRVARPGPARVPLSTTAPGGEGSGWAGEDGYQIPGSVSPGAGIGR